MKKHLIYLPISLSVLLLTACTSPTSYEDNASSSILSEEENLDNNSMIDVDQGLLNVTITLDAALFGYTYPNEVIEEARINGITATHNDDGSFTYVMSRSTHNEMMQDMSIGIEESIAEILYDDTMVTSVLDITHANNFTEFNIIVSREDFESSFLDPFVIFTFGVQGMMYQAFNGTPDNNVTVNVVDSVTNEIFQTVVYPDALEG
jgi:hypothetical protein